MFLEVDKTCVAFFGILPRFPEKLQEEEDLDCGATASKKTALGILQLWFNYFETSFFLAYTFPGRLRSEMPAS